MGELAWQRFHLHYVVKKFDDIHDFLRSNAFVLAFKQARIVDFHECRATDRRSDHIVKLLEFLLEFLGERHSHFLEAGIGHGLSATSLVERISDIQSKMLQELVCSNTDLRIDGIDITGNK